MSVRSRYGAVGTPRDDTSPLPSLLPASRVTSPRSQEARRASRTADLGPTALLLATTLGANLLGSDAGTEKTNGTYDVTLATRYVAVGDVLSGSLEGYVTDSTDVFQCTLNFYDAGAALLTSVGGTTFSNTSYGSRSVVENVVVPTGAVTAKLSAAIVGSRTLTAASDAFTEASGTALNGHNAGTGYGAWSRVIDGVTARVWTIEGNQAVPALGPPPSYDGTVYYTAATTTSDNYLESWTVTRPVDGNMDFEVWALGTRNAGGFAGLYALFTGVVLTDDLTISLQRWDAAGAAVEEYGIQSAYTEHVKGATLTYRFVVTGNRVTLQALIETVWTNVGAATFTSGLTTNTRSALFDSSQNAPGAVLADQLKVDTLTRTRLRVGLFGVLYGAATAASGNVLTRRAMLNRGSVARPFEPPAFLLGVNTLNDIITAVQGDLIYGSSAGVWSTLAVGASGRWLGSSGTAPQWNAPTALTKTDDTNVTLTLGGSPTTALLNAASITVGWTGTLAAARLNANVVQSVVNDTNVTGSIAAQALTLGWTGQLSVARGGTGLGSLTAHAVVTGGAAGTAFGFVAPSTAKNVLASDGTDWVSARVDASYVDAGTFPSGDYTFASGDVTVIGASGIARYLFVGATADLFVQRNDATALGANFIGRRGRGTFGTPLYPQASDVLAVFGAQGYDEAGATYRTQTQMFAAAWNTWTATDRAAYIGFRTTATGATTEVERWTLYPGGDWNPASDNAYDVGRTAARVKTGYFYTVNAATSVTTDTVSERTGAAGVTIDGVLLKDISVRVTHVANSAEGIRLTQTAAGGQSPRLFFENTTDYSGSGNAIFNTAANQLSFTTGATAGSGSGTRRLNYDTAAFWPESDNAMTLGTSSKAWSTVYGYTGTFATRVTTPIVGTTTAANTVVQRNSTAIATFGAADVTLASGISLLLTSGNLKLQAAGNGLYVKEGVNATMGAATLVAGTVTVSTSKVTTSSRIFLAVEAVGGTLGIVSVGTITAGVSFVINSSNVLDTSTVAWIIVEPA